MTTVQQAWLRTTPLPLRSLRFHPLDEASTIIRQQVRHSALRNFVIRSLIPLC